MHKLWFHICAPILASYNLIQINSSTIKTVSVLELSTPRTHVFSSSHPMLPMSYRDAFSQTDFCRLLAQTRPKGGTSQSSLLGGPPCSLALVKEGSWGWGFPSGLWEQASESDCPPPSPPLIGLEKPPLKVSTLREKICFLKKKKKCELCATYSIYICLLCKTDIQ